MYSSTHSHSLTQMDVRGQFHASASFFRGEEAAYSILLGWANFHIFTKIQVFWDVTLRH